MKTYIAWLVFILYTTIMITLFIEAIFRNDWLYAGVGALLFDHWIDGLTP